MTINTVGRVDRLQSCWLTLTAALMHCLSVVKFGHNAVLREYWLQLKCSSAISSYILQLVHFHQSLNSQLFSVSVLHWKNYSGSENVATFRSQYSFNFKVLPVLHKRLH